MGKRESGMAGRVWGRRAVPPLEQGIERLVGTAFLDEGLARRLLQDPGAVALAFGLSAAEAERIADLRAADLAGFARALSARLYGLSCTYEQQSRVAGR
jgi:hypothetical protein